MANSRNFGSMMSPMLLFSCFCLLVGDMLFGYDTSSFGGILANPGFVRQFGQYHPKTKTYAIDSLHTSLLSSLAFIGKFIGCLSAGPAIERFGIASCFLVSQLSRLWVLSITAADTGAGTGRLAQFIVGRIIVYISVGLVEVDITTYQSEIVPSHFRGAVVVSLQLFLSAGSILASGINKAFATRTDGLGWKTITGIQFIFPVLIILFTLFIPSSPRWLISKDRNEDAITALCRLRSKAYAANGLCAAEIQAIQEALRQHVHKSPWFDLVRGNDLYRTMIVMVYYFSQQTTGQAFVSTYQTVFYKTNGYAQNAFTYPIITSCLTFICIVPVMYMVDKVGYAHNPIVDCRYCLMFSFTIQAFWMYLLSGIGELQQKTHSEKNTIVAAFMLYAISYNMGGASIPYLLGAEIPNSAVREKTQALGSAWNVVWAFVTNFVIPYMINDIHFQVGWVFGSISVLALLFTVFLLPETKGLALEEIDAIFAVPYNPFRSAEIHETPTQGRVGELESKKQIVVEKNGDYAQEVVAV
ncbi:sugar transporter, putative [Talaromyces stipitatus ATCC 10500]|uniref:Sugar transporter, putative n=1 Tax=Talaromyces stipitatus (strain ATCC 10500 / CBS 375.48 / QM 6759 / NRRL 1006) TaxID=441959 RepID=B8ME18_TALSN|nr:sugar transporter, putative [Talaromyces stipitatus ATCC 10500]EED16095.1 sugar transporter, putative [Talaromyces stipitatus ATCC 10500]